MEGSIRRQTFIGIGWSAIERFATIGISFIIQIILARLLSPSDYGIIGILAIFLQIAQVFIDCGFGQALVQKQDCSEKDYSTVFYYNFGVAVAIYVLFYVVAPFVSSFYDIPLLKSVMRVLSLTFIINSLTIVQRTKLTKQIDFKTISKISLAGVIISGLFGIFLAYNNMGVWALVGQTLCSGVLQVLFFFIVIRWIPQFVFDKVSFKQLFGYGSKLLVANIINVIYRNLYTLVIGKKYTSIEVGYYNRSEQFANFPATTLTGILTRVIFPILSKLQDDDTKLCVAYRKSIRYSSFVIFPIMIWMLSMSEPIILCLLTDKWSNVIPLLQILCLDWMLDHISSLNLNLLLVKGRTDLALKLEIIKKTIAFSILVISIPFGLVYMCWGRVLYSITATYINTYYTKRLIGLSFSQQMTDIIPYLLGAFAMGATAHIGVLISVSSLLQIIIGTSLGIIMYGIISLIFYKETINDLLIMVKK